MGKVFEEHTLYIPDGAFINKDFDEVNSVLAQLLHKLGGEKQAVEAIELGWSKSRVLFRIKIITSRQISDSPDEPRGPRRRFDL